ncbi:ABC transporter permease [Candidatus Amarolinea aalborgensis]|uniref:ABC transporter permease n=1 Tax=Candidatus Amarolinea aalborgensis TaxID=2249329 RepID=UPI003BF9B8F0
MILRTLALMRKEFRHMFRDRRTLITLFAIPIVQLILLGYAANTNVEHLKTAVLDLDRSAESRHLIATYQASNYFDIVIYPADYEALGRLVDRGEVRAGIVIPAGFGTALIRRERPAIEFIIDGSDPAIANVAFASSQSVGQAFSIQVLTALIHTDLQHQPGVDVRPRVWYNPEMRSANYMVPGLVGIILQMLSMMTTALAIVREREQGTMEQLIVTPMRPLEMILGKVTPYALIVFINTCAVLVIAVFWFQVPIHGSVTLLLLLNAFAMISSLALGLMISTIAHTQQEAMMSTYFFFLPSIFLAGYIFPLEAMPAPLQFVSQFVPLRYLLTIIRAVVLKGVGLEMIWREVVILGLFSVVILAVATARFRKRLE